MDRYSALSLIFLLFVFTVLPSLLKLLGRYASGSKDVGSREPDHEETVGEGLPGLPGNEGEFPEIRKESGQHTISNEPIHPKWF